MYSQRKIQRLRVQSTIIERVFLHVNKLLCSVRLVRSPSIRSVNSPEESQNTVFYRKWWVGGGGGVLNPQPSFCLSVFKMLQVCTFFQDRDPTQARIQDSERGGGGFVQEFQERIQIVAGPWANQQAKTKLQTAVGGGGGVRSPPPQKKTCIGACHPPPAFDEIVDPPLTGRLWFFFNRGAISKSVKHCSDVRSMIMSIFCIERAAL